MELQDDVGDGTMTFVVLDDESFNYGKCGIFDNI
jgi:hypothetical protein